MSMLDLIHYISVFVSDQGLCCKKTFRCRAGATIDLFQFVVSRQETLRIYDFYSGSLFQLCDIFRIGVPITGEFRLRHFECFVVCLICPNAQRIVFVTGFYQGLIEIFVVNANNLCHKLNLIGSPQVGIQDIKKNTRVFATQKPACKSQCCLKYGGIVEYIPVCADDFCEQRFVVGIRDFSSIGFAGSTFELLAHVI